MEIGRELGCLNQVIFIDMSNLYGICRSSYAVDFDFDGNGMEFALRKAKRVADKVKPAAAPIPGGQSYKYPSIRTRDRRLPEEGSRWTEERLDRLFAKSRKQFPGFLREAEIDYLKGEFCRSTKRFRLT